MSSQAGAWEQEKNRFIRSAKIKRSVFLHPAGLPEYMQKTAALYFCTPNICKKPLRSIFALRIYAKNRCALFLHSGFMKFFDLPGLGSGKIYNNEYGSVCNKYSYFFFST
ncbi:MAG: hypothetical protein BWK80_51510 [Desulfobacteraceae bacterium IS3]|nr:MAG: hypothetical protein BWK80_51510 [Desulfobacteraceae bacterium IS3]